MQHTQFVIFEITDRCNLAGEHAPRCPVSNPERWANVDTTRRLTDEAIVAMAAEAWALGFRGLFGWHYYCEPTLELPRIERLMAAIRREVPRAGFILWTNGLLLPDDLARIGRFDRVWITNYRNLNWPNVRHNMADCVTVMRPAMDGRTDGARGECLGPCLRPYNELIVDAFGNGRLCCMDWRGEVRLGNIWDDGFSGVAAAVMQIRELAQAGGDALPAACRRCQFHQQGVPDLSPTIAAETRAMLAGTPPAKVGLCLIATGAYQQFLPACLSSARELFLPWHDVTFHVFSEHFHHAIPGVKWHKADHEPWPMPTLLRYRTMLTAADELAEHDYLYYLDVDTQFARPVGREVFGDLVATRHFGYLDRPPAELPYERRLASKAFVRPDHGQAYYAGAFQGGRAARYLMAMREMAAAIDADLERGVIAQWHDESHWNRYLIDHPPTLVLPHEYCCPPEWRPWTQRIRIVGKNVAEVRA